MSPNPAPQRRGMLLIVIVGLAAILLSLSVTFLARMRADARESSFVVNEAQARIMLHAAMNYIQETSRLGWYDRRNPDYTGHGGIVMREGFGWTDVRGAVAKWNQNGSPVVATADEPLDLGPIDQFGRRMWNPPPAMGDPWPMGVWPAPHSVARCPMFVHQRPPFAIEDRLAPNAFDPQNPGTQRRDYTARYPMTQPPVRPVATAWSDFVLDGTDPASDAQARAPLAEGLDLAWFRVYREPAVMHNGRNDYPSDPPPANEPSDVFDVVDLSGHHGIFIITCGAGGSQGFRDWTEVEAEYPDASTRPFDRVTFEQLRASERLLWYRVEWSPAVLPGNHSSNAESGDLDQNATDKTDLRVHNLFRISPDRDTDWGGAGGGKESEVGAVRSRIGIASAEVVAGPDAKALEGGSFARNPVGTIQWIMRLEREPPEW